MEDDPIVMTVLSILLFGGVIAGIWIARRNAKILRKVKIEEEDGTLRSPTKDELWEISQSLARDKGKHFWHIIVAGIILVGLACLALKLLMITK